MDVMDDVVQEMVRKRHQRRRTVLVSLSAAAVIVVAIAIGVGFIVTTNTSGPGEPPSQVPAGTANGDASGLVVSTGSVQIDLYVDYLCPECRSTEQAIAPELAALKASGKVRLVYHPVAFLDPYSKPGGYSTRAASAAACAAQSGRFEQYSTVLFDKQPAERGPGLSAAELVDAGRDAGLTGEAFASCVTSGTYIPWVKYVTDVAASRDVAVTPTVVVNGRPVDLTGSDPGLALDRAVTEAER
jgi:protein-disulfide isomerase